MQVTIINLVVIDGKEINIKDLTPEARNALADKLNRAALEKRNYILDKTA